MFVGRSKGSPASSRIRARERPAVERGHDLDAGGLGTPAAAAGPAKEVEGAEAPIGGGAGGHGGMATDPPCFVTNIMPIWRQFGGIGNIKREFAEGRISERGLSPVGRTSGLPVPGASG